jgi:hypothetical protein
MQRPEDKYSLCRFTVEPVLAALTSEWQTQSDIARKLGVRLCSLAPTMNYLANHRRDVERRQRIGQPSLYRLKGVPQ